MVELTGAKIRGDGSRAMVDAHGDDDAGSVSVKVQPCAKPSMASLRKARRGGTARSGGVAGRWALCAQCGWRVMGYFDFQT